MFIYLYIYLLIQLHLSICYFIRLLWNVTYFFTSSFAYLFAWVKGEKRTIIFLVESTYLGIKAAFASIGRLFGEAYPQPVLLQPCAKLIFTFRIYTFFRGTLLEMCLTSFFKLFFGNSAKN